MESFHRFKSTNRQINLKTTAFWGGKSLPVLWRLFSPTERHLYRSTPQPTLFFLCKKKKPQETLISACVTGDPRDTHTHTLKHTQKPSSLKQRHFLARRCVTPTNPVARFQFHHSYTSPPPNHFHSATLVGFNTASISTRVVFKTRLPSKRDGFFFS